MNAQQIINTLSYCASSPRKLSDWEIEKIRDRACQVATPDELRQIESLIRTCQ